MESGNELLYITRLETGKAYVGGACTEWPFSINLAYHTDMDTGETLAHEMGHNLGMEHDFLSGKRGRTCGPGQGVPGGGMMNYGKPLGAKIWSDCSTQDFTRYFQQHQPFCLKTSKFIY